MSVQVYPSIRGLEIDLPVDPGPGLGPGYTQDPGMDSEGLVGDVWLGGTTGSKPDLSLQASSPP